MTQYCLTSREKSLKCYTYAAFVIMITRKMHFFCYYNQGTVIKASKLKSGNKHKTNSQNKTRVLCYKSNYSLLGKKKTHKKL